MKYHQSQLLKSNSIAIPQMEPKSNKYVVDEEIIKNLFGTEKNGNHNLHD